MISAIKVLCYVLEHRNMIEFPNYATIADKYGIGKNTLCYYKTGKHSPSFDVVVGLVETLGFDICEVINEVKNR